MLFRDYIGNKSCLVGNKNKGCDYSENANVMVEGFEKDKLEGENYCSVMQN